MINFFRKTRKKQADDNKFFKYARYAIGEIVLVVIGILLALQINNWNEEKQMKNTIYETLGEIREDLVMDTLHLYDVIEVRREDLISQGRVIRTLSNKTLFSEQTYADLGRVMLQRPTTLMTNGYELIKELGMSNLNNRELRNSLVEYYEGMHRRIDKELGDDTMEFEAAWLPYVRMHFAEWEFGEKAIPHNDEQVAEDTSFLMTLKMNHNNLTATLVAHQNALQKARDLIVMIDTIIAVE